MFSLLISLLLPSCLAELDPVADVELYTNGIQFTPDPTIGGFIGEKSPVFADLDGDGMDEFIIANPQGVYPPSPAPIGYEEGSRGVIHVIWGGQSFSAPSTQPIPTAGPTSAPTGMFIGATFAGTNPIAVGHTIAAAGDTNGDGYEDLLVVTGASLTVPAKIFLVLGRARESFSNPLLLPLDTEDDPLIIKLLLPKDVAEEYYVYGGKDVNGDGLPDIIIGDPDRDTSKGRVFIVFGRPLWLPNVDVEVTDGISSTLLMPLLPGPSPTPMPSLPTASQLGRSVHLCDVDGDGMADLIMDAREGPETTYVFYGKAAVNWVGTEDLNGLDGSTTGFTLFHGDTTVIAIACGELTGDAAEDLVLGNRAASSDDGVGYIFNGQTDRKDLPATTLDLTKDLTNTGDGIAMFLSGQGGRLGSAVGLSGLPDPTTWPAWGTNTRPGFMLSAPLEELPLGEGGAAQEGWVFVFRGISGNIWPTAISNLATAPSPEVFVIRGTTENAFCGHALSEVGNYQGGIATSMGFSCVGANVVVLSLGISATASPTSPPTFSFAPTLSPSTPPTPAPSTPPTLSPTHSPAVITPTPTQSPTDVGLSDGATIGIIAGVVVGVTVAAAVASSTAAGGGAAAVSAV